LAIGGQNSGCQTERRAVRKRIYELEKFHLQVGFSPGFPLVKDMPKIVHFFLDKYFIQA